MPRLTPRQLALLRAQSMSPERRQEIARQAVNARWARYYLTHPKPSPSQGEPKP